MTYEPGDAVAISDLEPAKTVTKRKRVRRKKKGDILDPYEYLAETFGKTLVEPVDVIPKDSHWYAWKGPADAAALFMDTRKFEPYTYMAELRKRPAEATGAVVFF